MKITFVVDSLEDFKNLLYGTTKKETGYSIFVDILESMKKRGDRSALGSKSIGLWVITHSNVKTGNYTIRIMEKADE